MESITQRILDLAYRINGSDLDISVIRDQLSELVEIVAEIAGGEN